jgi:hypothetical protein
MIATCFAFGSTFAMDFMYYNNSPSSRVYEARKGLNLQVYLAHGII